MIQIQVDANAPPWAHHMARTIEQAVSKALNQQSPRRLPKYASAALPDASRFEGHQIYVTTTNRVAYSDGTDWRYQSDEATV
jgi:uncharacterized lipoprotein YmbA